MREIGDCLQRLDEDVVILLTGDSCDEPDSAGVMLERRIVERRVHPNSMPSVHALTSRHAKGPVYRITLQRDILWDTKGRPFRDRPSPVGYLARCTGASPPPVWEHRARFIVGVDYDFCECTVLGHAAQVLSCEIPNPVAVDRWCGNDRQTVGIRLGATKIPSPAWWWSLSAVQDVAAR